MKKSVKEYKRVKKSEKVGAPISTSYVKFSQIYRIILYKIEESEK